LGGVRTSEGKAKKRVGGEGERERLLGEGEREEREGRRGKGGKVDDQGLQRLSFL
jgi:hypothetical protein